MTDYATAPVTGKVYGNGGIQGVMDDAWMGVDHTIPADVADRFDDARRLTLGPSAVFLAWEQGGNSPEMVFALKANSCQDFAERVDFGLHYLADEPDDPDLPKVLRDWYRPVADLITRLALETGTPIRDRGARVMQELFAQVAEHGILRAKDYDEDTDKLVGLDRDIAADLPAAWAAKVAEETAA